MGAYTNDVDAARSEALRVFGANDVPTDGIDAAYDEWAGWKGQAAWLVATDIDPFITDADTYACSGFWTALDTWYRSTYPGSTPDTDEVLGWLDSAARIAAPDFQAQRYVTPSDVLDTTLDTAAKVGEEIRKDTKLAAMAIPFAAAVGAAVWLSR